MSRDLSPLRLATPRSVRSVTVLEVVSTRGAGVERDPIREVTQYWSTDGILLAERDPHPPPEPSS